MRKIIDAHSHLFQNETEIPAFEKACEELNIKKICFMGLEFPGADMSRNSVIRTAIAQRPDLFVGFGGINLWEDVDPSVVDRLYDEGFRGLKFIVPAVPYHDIRYYPYYERALKYHMPVCFHLGIVSRKENYECRVDNNLMRPIYLDTIARDFPELKLWGAHLGNPWYEEATMSCRWNPNLFFDLSGSTLKKKKSAFLGELLWWTDKTYYKSPDRSMAWQKILFGSDVIAEDIHDLVNDYNNLIEALGLESFADEIFYETAARHLREAGVEC